MLFNLAYEKMSKTKHGLSFLNSFQICRPKTPCSMIKSPLPALTYMCSSPGSSSTFDISFPAFPDPPPPTPSMIAPVQDHFVSRAYSKPRNREKQRTESKERETSRTNKKKYKVESVSSGESDETESLFSSQDSSQPSRTGCEGQVRQKSRRAQRFKRYGSKEWKCNEKKAISGEVEESFVVVKRSVDPYEDFKKSMSEMILEKQMFEPKELEQLLMSFLSLNSRLHHKVIVEAFTEVLEQVFCG